MTFSSSIHCCDNVGALDWFRQIAPNAQANRNALRVKI